MSTTKIQIENKYYQLSGKISSKKKKDNTEGYSIMFFYQKDTMTLNAYALSNAASNI